MSYRPSLPAPTESTVHTYSLLLTKMKLVMIIIDRKKTIPCIYSQSGTTFHCQSRAMMADVVKEHAISESTYLKLNLCNALIIPKIVNIDNKRMVIDRDRLT